jgi:hypothetical protein
MRQYKIFANKEYERRIICNLRIMVSPFDPEPNQQISHRIEEWLESEVGQWVQLNCKEITKEEYKSYDPALDKIFYGIKIIGYCTAEDWTYYTLKFK